MSGSPMHRHVDVEELVAACRADLAAAGMFAAHPVTSVARSFFTRIGVDGWARLPLAHQCALPLTPPPISDVLQRPGSGTVQCNGQQPNSCVYTPAGGPTAVYSPQSGELVGPGGVKYGRELEENRRRRMDGDAGASRLNPTAADDSSSKEATAEDSSESEVGTDQTGTEVTAEDVSGAGPESPVAERGPSRLGRGWLIGITAALLVLAGGVGAGGYIALRVHLDSRTLARDDAAAIQAAKECVAATQAPDTAAMAASARKIVECSTGDFGAQAALYSGLLVDAYQAANVHVQVSDMRAAVERNNNDGSVDVLVALRVKVTNTEAKDQESGYRLRVKMTSDDGQYKISKLEQVTK